jgi:NADH:ubiquinone oxidoreductase subunit B-like Fe-S oxidoreductase
MYQILKQIIHVGLKSEPPPAPDLTLRVTTDRLKDEVLRLFKGSLAIRHVDAGSCNGCELEIHMLNNPYYNLEQLGIKFVASPRHADLLLVSGPVSRNMEVALRRTFDAAAPAGCSERVTRAADASPM